MIAKVLIANRGEIACRIIATLRRMGIASAAIYSDADRAAHHAVLADQAYHVGPPPASESYLDQEAVLDAARRSGADAIHPGYGFLSENADFAERCASAGLIFIGPPPSAIRAMGLKSQAKRLMEAADVPLVPGYHGVDQDDGRLQDAATQIGFPLLIKASAGGGGKGMKIVDHPGHFMAQLDSARREARSAFGDDAVLLERYFPVSRHVEVQVFADRHGQVVHLFDRDCSIQRRHQKVIEEAPAPDISARTRARMAAAAINAAQAVEYVGAGTVEFLLDASAKRGGFYFLEMNTRLQVEHPVTEMITGLDLVEWQVRVAAGEPLPLRQDQVECRGHAVEARLYAENPAAGFLPQAGQLTEAEFPAPSAYVRVDSGVRAGDPISTFYDPMIAKLVVWDHDRDGAVRQLGKALDETRLGGPATNLAFLRRIARSGAFTAAAVDTRFIEQHRAELLPPGEVPPDDAWIIAATALLERRRTAGRRSDPADPHTPWSLTSAWRLNDESREQLVLAAVDDSAEPAEWTVKASWNAGGIELSFLDEGPSCTVTEIMLGPTGNLSLALPDRRLSAAISFSGADIAIHLRGTDYRLRLRDALADAGALDQDRDSLVTPMPGRVIAVMVEPGAAVAKGQPLLVIEAMKMEHTVTAPQSGTVQALPFREGDQVPEGAELAKITAG